MVPTSPQDVQPALTARRQLWLYVALFALILLLGAAAYIQTILPLLIAGAIVAIGFFQVLSFRALFLLLLLLFFLISPAIPVSEKHFSKPISGGGFFLQDAVLLLLFGRALFDYFNAPRALQPFRSTLLEQIFALYVAVNLASAVYGALNGNTPTYLLGDVRDFFYFLLFWVYLHYFKSEADLDFAFTALIVSGVYLRGHQSCRRPSDSQLCALQFWHFLFACGVNACPAFQDFHGKTLHQETIDVYHAAGDAGGSFYHFHAWAVSWLCGWIFHDAFGFGLEAVFQVGAHSWRAGTGRAGRDAGIGNKF
jgi:hypothetical protein